MTTRKTGSRKPNSGRHRRRPGGLPDGGRRRRPGEGAGPLARQPGAKRRADTCVPGAVAPSAALNATAAASHARGSLVGLAAACGACVPLPAYAAGRVAGALWAGR
jgi:hypothetical protein